MIFAIATFLTDIVESAATSFTVCLLTKTEERNELDIDACTIIYEPMYTLCVLSLL